MLVGVLIAIILCSASNGNAGSIRVETVVVKSAHDAQKYGYFCEPYFQIYIMVQYSLVGGGATSA